MLLNIIRDNTNATASHENPRADVRDVRLRSMIPWKTLSTVYLARVLLLRGLGFFTVGAQPLPCFSSNECLEMVRSRLHRLSGSWMRVADFV